MTTLQIAKSSGQKIKIGKLVLCGVGAVDTTPIASQVAAFQSAQQHYVIAQQSVVAASSALQDQRARVAVANYELGVAIEALAIALPSDGFARRNPFQTFGTPSPSTLMSLSFVDRASGVAELEKAVSRHPAVSAKTSLVAQAAGDAARTLLETLGPLDELEKARADAIAQREAFAPAWDRTFLSLKLGARAADYAGHAGLFAALFERPAPTRKTASSKRKVLPNPDVAPLSVPG